MTTEQENILRRLQSRIKQKLEIDEYGGEVFTQSQGVTVKIGRNAGIEVPSLRSYDDPFEAALDAGRLFRLQQERDSENPERADQFTTGHFNPRWDLREEHCIGNRKCPLCKSSSK